MSEFWAGFRDIWRLYTFRGTDHALVKTGLVMAGALFGAVTIVASFFSVLVAVVVFVPR